MAISLDEYKKRGGIVSYGETSVSKPKNNRKLDTGSVDYSNYSVADLRKEKEKLRKQLTNYSGITKQDGSYSLKGIWEAMSGQSEKKLKKDKDYALVQKKYDDVIKQLENKFEYKSDTGNKKIDKLNDQLYKTSENLNKSLNNFNASTQAVVKDPLHYVPKALIGANEGINRSLNNLESSGDDLIDFLTFGNYKKGIGYKNRKMEKQIMDGKTLGTLYKNTDTYKDYVSGNLNESEQAVFNVGSNIGAMVPSIVATAVTKNPNVGRAVFYSQAQQSYTEEALNRGYDDNKARVYGLMMAGVETAVESIGFDELGGLSKVSKDNIFKNMFGEGAEEFVTPYFDAIARKAFGEDINWSEVNEEAINGAMMGAIVSGIMTMGGRGYTAVDNFINKKNANQTITSEDYQNALNEIEQNNPGYTESILRQVSENITQEDLNEISDKLGLEDVNQSELGKDPEEIKKAIAYATDEKTKQQLEKHLEKIEPQMKQEKPIEKNETVDETSKKEVKKQEVKKQEVKQEDKIKNLSDDELETTKKSAELLGYDTKSIEEEQERRKKEREIEKKQDEKFVSDVEKMLLDQTTKEEFNDYWADKFGLKDVDKIISDKKFSTLNDEQLLGLKKSAVLLGYDVDDINSEIQLRKKENRIKQEDLDNFNKESEKMLFEYNDKLKEKTEEYAKMFGLSDNLDNKVKEDKREISSHTKTIENSIKQKEVQAKQQIKDVKDRINKTFQETSVEEDLSNNDYKIDKKGNINASREFKEEIEKINEPPTEKTTTIKGKGIDGEEITLKKVSTNKGNENLEQTLKEVRDNITTKQAREFEREQQKIERTISRLIEDAKKQGNKELAKQLEFDLENHTFDSRKIKSEYVIEYVKVQEDVDGEFDNFDRLFNSEKRKDASTVTKGQALYNTYIEKGDWRQASIVGERLSTIAHENATALAQMAVLYNDSPAGVVFMLQRTMRDAYNYDLHNRFGGRSEAWKIKNDPKDMNNNSPYRLKEEDFDELTTLASKLYDIKDRNSVEYKKALADLTETARSKIPGSFGKKLMNFRMTGLLSSPAVWIKNGKSNLIEIAYNGGRNLIATGSDIAVEKIFKTNQRTKGLSIKGVKSFGTGIVKGIKDQIHEFKYGVTVSEFGNRYSNKSKSVENVIDDVKNNMDLDGKASGFGKILDNKVVDLYTRAVNLGMSTDAIVAQGYHDYTLTTLKILNAKKQAVTNKENVIVNIKESSSNTTELQWVDTEGNSYTEIADNNEIKKFIQDKQMKTISNLDELEKIALREGEMNTYSDENAWTTTASNIKRGLNKIGIGDMRLGNFIIPFTRSGTNSIYRFLQSTPLGAISIAKDIRDFTTTLEYNKNLEEKNKQLKSEGKLTQNLKSTYELQHKLVDDISRTVSGCVATYLFAAFAKALIGNISGGDDEDNSKAKALLEDILGNKDYSLKIGDFNVTFDIGGVFGLSMKMNSDLVEIANKETNELNKFYDFIDTTTQNLIDESILSNLLEYSNTQYGSVMENLAYKSAQLPSTVIPSFIRDIAITMDDFTKRKTTSNAKDPIINWYETMKNNFEERLPGLRDNLQNQYDSFGNIKKYGTDTMTNIFNTWIIRNGISKSNTDVVAKEIMDVYMDSEDSSVLPNNKLKTTLTYNNKKYEMDEDEFDDYQKKYSSTYYKSVEKLIRLSTYKNSSLSEKQKLLSAVQEYSKDQANKRYIESLGKSYYNTTQDNLPVYKDLAIKYVLEDNISLEEAKVKRKNPNKYAYIKTMGDYDYYKSARDRITNIQNNAKKLGMSTKQTKKLVVNYVKTLGKYTSVQKSMLIKEFYKDMYSNYDKQIYNYLKKQGLSSSELKYARSSSLLGLEGYYIPIYKSK